METNKLAAIGVAAATLIAYNLTQPGLLSLRDNAEKYGTTSRTKAYGPSLAWLDRVANASGDSTSVIVDRDGNMENLGTGKEPAKASTVKLDFSVLSSVMVAGLASGFKSQVANLLWMKSDEYWHQGLFTRQVPLMEAVVTLDPQFIEAWSTAGWHWAYNIYADIPTNPEYKKRGEKYIRTLQENAVQTGLDYLRRGAQANPDGYRLWFEWGWTRAEKAGYYDEETLKLYEIARSKPDAMNMERTKKGPDGQPVTEIVKGLDVLGRTIGHLYEKIPEFDKTLDHYAYDLMGMRRNNAQDQQKLKMLQKVGEFWHDYGTDYHFLRSVYQDGDATVKSRIRQLEPRIDELIEADKVRHVIDNQPGKDQPVGAYVSICARYLPAWRMWKAGNPDGAIAQMVGNMNADPKYCLKKLNILGEVMELRGDAPNLVKARMEFEREVERESSQDIGLHFLAKLYEAQAAKYKDSNPAMYKKAVRKAYETWYRSRERDALDFYALRNTRKYEDEFGFTAPQNIIDEIKNSRKKGVPNAAPPVAPNVEGYYS